MTTVTEFRTRAKDVRAYLKSLSALELLLTSGGKAFFRAAPTVTASRAAAFIMMYNCIEYAARESMADLRKQIQTEVTDFGTLSLHWKTEIVRARFHPSLRDGVQFVNFLSEIAAYLPGTVDWGQMDALPFAGNVDQQKLFKWSKSVGAKWKAPRSTLGGSDLATIRNMRNDLAHGQETFANVGGQFTTQDLIVLFDRSRDFVLAFLKAVDRYGAKKKYLN